MDEQAPFLSPAPGGLAADATWWITASDGVRLRAALWTAPNARAHCVLCTGRTEYIEKASLPAAELVARGFSVISVDWRGQGLSDRATDDTLKGHVGDFAEFQRDLDALLATDQAKALPGPRLLMCHSMGGLIGAGALQRPEISETVAATVFSAPMFGIAMAAPMRAAAWVTVKIGMALGMAKRWPPFGDVKTPYVLSDPDDNVLTGDPAVWDWMVKIARDHPATSIALPTLGWFAAATRELNRATPKMSKGIPTLVLLGSKEAVVDPSSVRAGAKRLGATLMDIKEARHEVLIEEPRLRAEAWAGIDAFLSQNGLVPSQS